MSLKTYLKRGLTYVIKGVPQKKVSASITYLSTNELLKGRTAFITGGTSGIGFAIAKAFLNSGANVIITGRNSQKLEETMCLLSNKPEYKNKVLGIVMDNKKVDTFKEHLDNVINHFGKIDILVNNAGVIGGAIKNTTEEEYDTIMQTNLKAVFFLSQLVGKYMKEKHIEGNILNIASSSSLRPAVSAYTISKWGIRGLTMGLARSLAPYGIVVNGLAPGQTATPMLQKKETDDLYNPSTLINRYATAEEIANMAVILTSNMSRSIIGDIVYMTGGSGLLSFEDMDYSF